MARRSQASATPHGVCGVDPKGGAWRGLLAVGVLLLLLLVSSNGALAAGLPEAAAGTPAARPAGEFVPAPDPAPIPPPPQAEHASPPAPPPEVAPAPAPAPPVTSSAAGSAPKTEAQPKTNAKKPTKATKTGANRPASDKAPPGAKQHPRPAVPEVLPAPAPPVQPDSTASPKVISGVEASIGDPAGTRPEISGRTGAGSGGEAEPTSASSSGTLISALLLGALGISLVLLAVAIVPPSVIGRQRAGAVLAAYREQIGLTGISALCAVAIAFLLQQSKF